MAKNDYITPEFLFCELPVKNGSFNDERIWIYHTKSLSLIEFINVDNFDDFQFKGLQDRFEYESIIDDEIENFFGVFVQNNCEYTNHKPSDVLKNAWLFYQTYLRWEDQNILDQNPNE